MQQGIEYQSLKIKDLKTIDEQAGKPGKKNGPNIIGAVYL